MKLRLCLFLMCFAETKKGGYSGRQDQLAVHGHTGFRAWPSDDQRCKRSLPVGQIRVTQQTDSGPRIRSWQVEMPFFLPEIQPWYTPRNTLAFLRAWCSQVYGRPDATATQYMSILGVPKIGLPPNHPFSIGFSLQKTIQLRRVLHGTLHIVLYFLHLFTYLKTSNLVWWMPRSWISNQRW